MDKIVEPLLYWYHENKRDLPWRKTKNPYHIWISEIMLQQTQVKTVIPYYIRFLEVLPDYHSLAKVDENQLLKLWEGLGYYSRARNLKMAAMQISAQFNHFPNKYDDLIKLKGIGPYSGGAIASIAYNEKRPAVDGNVLRVISRLLNSEKDISLKSTYQYIYNEVYNILPNNSGDFNQALMELGATVCIPKNPKCSICPVNKYCHALKQNNVSNIPKKSSKIKKEIQLKTIIIMVYQDEIAIMKNSETILKNMWYFPLISKHLTYDDIIQKYDCTECYALSNYRHIFTHLIWDIKAYVVYVDYKDVNFIWKKRIEIQNEVALPKAFKRYFDEFIELESRIEYER